MRISTSMLHDQALAGIQQSQARAMRTQSELAANTRLLSAADDPGAMAQSLSLDQRLSRLEAWTRNADTATSRLGQEEAALSGSADVLNRVRELALQANNGTQSAESRANIASELEQLQQQLLAYANTGDGEGGYLFGGSASGAAPFALSGGGASYSGDALVRSLQVGDYREVADADAGSAVFMQLRSGNGRFDMAGAPANSGTAALSRAVVTDAATWNGAAYTVTFSAGAYEVRDAGNALVGGGAFVAGQAIRHGGVELVFTGTPADGDSFALTPSTSSDAFAAVQKLIGAVKADASSPAARAQRQTGFLGVIAEIDGALNRVNDVRGSVGNRLAAVDDARSALQGQTLLAQQALSPLRDLDLAEASTRLNMQLTALQAAQKSYMSIQGLSLFNYLR